MWDCNPRFHEMKKIQKNRSPTEECEIIERTQQYIFREHCLQVEKQSWDNNCECACVNVDVASFFRLSLYSFYRSIYGISENWSSKFTMWKWRNANWARLFAIDTLKMQYLWNRDAKIGIDWSARNWYFSLQTVKKAVIDSLTEQQQCANSRQKQTDRQTKTTLILFPLLFKLFFSTWNNGNHNYIEFRRFYWVNFINYI